MTLGGPAWLGAQGAPLPRAWAFTFNDRPARIGVLVNTDANAGTDSVGARLEAVTPGGPASAAGLKAGDVITKFNGFALAGASGVDGESGPGRRLVELVRTLTPGDSVEVEYRRGDETTKATLVAEAIADRPLPGSDGPMQRVELPGPGGMPFMGPGEGFSLCFGDAWCDMELVNLNPDLGEYFGTKDGILVIKAPADSSLPLRGGDVILDIGGRRPTSAAHAMRILRSYEPGETVALDVMRRQHRMTVTWHVPQPEDRMRRLMQLHEMHPDIQPDTDEDRSES